MNISTVLMATLISLASSVESNIDTMQGEFPAKTSATVFVKSPIIIEVNDFTDDAAKQFEKQMIAAQQTGQTIIPVIIDSYGGEVYALMRMVDVIQNFKIPVATIVEGKAMSCGAVLFTMGKEGYRFAGKNATILIHDVSGGAGGKVGEMKVSVDEAERLNNLIFSLMAKNTGHPADYFIKIVKSKGHADWFIPIDEAKKLNIVNKIKIPELKTIVDVKYVLE